jgi:hypothetical protein
MPVYAVVTVERNGIALTERVVQEIAGDHEVCDDNETGGPIDQGSEDRKNKRHDPAEKLGTETAKGSNKGEGEEYLVKNPAEAGVGEVSACVEDRQGRVGEPRPLRLRLFGHCELRVMVSWSVGVVGVFAIVNFWLWKKGRGDGWLGKRMWKRRIQR